jgi:hypothetical protein
MDITIPKVKAGDLVKIVHAHDGPVDVVVKNVGKDGTIDVEVDGAEIKKVPFNADGKKPDTWHTVPTPPAAK